MRRAQACAVVFLLASAQGCTTLPTQEAMEKRKLADAAIAHHRVEGDPAVEAAKAELEAELAREGSAVIVDGVELRAAADVQGDTAVPLLARMQVANPLVIREQRKAQRATSAAALAKLEGVALERRAARCLPSLDAQVYAEKTQIYEHYAARREAVRAWSSELGRAGMQNEIDTTEFELASQVGMTTRTPESPPPGFGILAADPFFAVLPEWPATAAKFRAEREFVRSAVKQGQPAVGVHRALEDHYRALEQREKLSRYPSLKFVDFGGEPLAHNGQQASVVGRIAVQVPFGQSARAESKRYAAMAISETSRGRLEAEEHVDQALIALSQLQTFHDNSRRWRDLLKLADEGEQTADHWFHNRLAPPRDIANLLDEVFRTRQAALETRERAGLADCALLAATGSTAASWPTE